MRTLTLILGVLAGLLLVSTLICGLWMRAQAVVDPSSVSFHMMIGVAAVLVTAVTLVLSISQAMRLPA